MSNSKKLIDAIAKQINKSPIFNNASSAIGNATERAQTKLSNVQNIAAEKYNTIVQQVNNATIIQDPNSPQTLQTAGPLPQRLINWWQWYQQLTGLDTVEMAKRQMIEVQNKLFQCQDHRRNLTRQANVINEKLKEIYGELIQTRREDPKYVQLTILENKGLQEQARIGGQLNLLENEERDNFTQLATAIKEYHDSQAMNAQKYKYLSILASAFLAILSLSGSMIYNNRRIADVRNVIAQAQEKNDQTFQQCFGSLESESKQNFSLIMSMLEGKAILPKNSPAASENHGKNMALETKSGTGLILENEERQSSSFYLGALAVTVLVMGFLGSQMK